MAEDFLSAIQSATVLTSLLAVVKYSISMRKKAMVFPFKILPLRKKNESTLENRASSLC